MKKFIYSVAFLLVTLSACNVSKNIETPAATLPVTFRNATETTDTNSIADIPWRDFFTDVTLQRLISKAIVNNYDMQVALTNIKASQLLLKQTNWNYVPEAALKVTANYTRASDNSITKLNLGQSNSGTNHIEDYSASLALSWEADIWGKIRNKNKSALATYLQTEEARKAIQTDVVAGVSQQYYNLLMLDEELAIAKKNVALNDSTLRIIRLQFDAGQVTSLAVQQAQAQQMVASQLIPQFEQDITVQENALQILTGELPGKVNRSTTLNDLPVKENLSAGIPSALVGHRPDVRSREFALTIANATVGIQKSEMYPALRITAEGGINSFKTSNWFNIPASLFGILAGSVVQPLLNHKLLKTQYEVAKVEREKAVIEFRQSVLVAVGEVSDALVKIEKLKTQQAIAFNRVQLLQQATANSRMLFQNGMADYLEVITAQNNVLQGELALASLKRMHLNAVSELYKALGGGWR